MSTTYVHLGRFGDIINTLPLLQLEAKRTGKPVPLVVAHHYASVLDGVSYVEPVVWYGHFEALPEAIAWAKATRGGRVVNLQVYGHGYTQPKRTGSFLLEQWANANLLERWGSPLEFDRRDLEEEAKLLATVDHGRPLVLVAAHGFSSPFTQGPALMEALRARLGSKASVVDLSAVKARRVYDLLGLMDAAACLIAIDTMHLHLAHGSPVPVIALATDGPTEWHASARRAGHVMYLRYREFAAKLPEILNTVEDLVTMQREVKAIRVVPGDDRLLHVYPLPALTGDALRRHRTARASWDRARDIRWVDVPAAASNLPRDARSIGSGRDLPFVRDLVELAVARSTSDEDVVMLSNTDVCVVSGIADQLLRVVRERGACFTHRWDFVGSVAHITAARVPTGKWYPGSDLFAFTVAWWKAHGQRYPDMLMGAEFVDAVLRQLIKETAGVDAEVHHAVYHEKHDNNWSREPHSAEALHNARLAQAWFAERGTDDLDPFSPTEASRIRAKRAQRRTR